jgi:dipeptidase E
VSAPRLVALGGHEFRSGPTELAIVDHLLRTTGAERPRVCLLPTASGDPTVAIQSYYSVLDRFRCDASHISLFRLERERVDLSRHLLSQDLIYVAGGSMLNLVAIWRAHRLDAILREAWRRGTLIAGQSAGAMCWFERGITASGGQPQVADGFGLLPGSLSVHYGRDPERREAYMAAIRGGLVPGFALDDGAGLMFEGTKPVEAFAGRRGARVVRVEMNGAGVRERELRPIPLRVRFERSPDPALDELRDMRRARASAGMVASTIVSWRSR